MKARLDFVSNSSSSSFIIGTSKPKKALIDFIVKGARASSKPDEDGYVHSWHTDFDAENKNFLKNALKSEIPVKLLIGSFDKFGEQWDEDYDEAKTIASLKVLVDREHVSDFIEKGKVKMTFEDFYAQKFDHTNADKQRIYDSYEITQDTIDFTRWFISHCDNGAPELVALDDFFKNELSEDERNGMKRVKGAKLKKWKKLSDDCIGKIICEDVDCYENGKSIAKPLSKVLDEYEALLKKGNRLFRLTFGYSGEGTDWSSYVWCDRFDFMKGNKDFKFMRDPEW